MMENDPMWRRINGRDEWYDGFYSGAIMIIILDCVALGLWLLIK